MVTKKGVYRLSIFQDAKYTRLIADCRRTMAGVRAGGREPGARHQDGAVEVYSYWKHWSCLFPQHGPGLKSKRRILLVEWQARIVARHPKALLRGLIHSDGCRVINRVNGYAYPRYLFTNHSADIRDIFCRTCDVLGVAWRRSMWHTISVARRESVAILDSFIGPKG